MCTLIEYVEKEKVQWNELTLYTPNDIPSQKSEEHGIRGKCGARVCTWGLCIATFSYLNFTEADMGAARIAIANILYKSQTSEKVVTTGII